MSSDPAERVAVGNAALARSDWAEARSQFQLALGTPLESRAQHGLGLVALFADGDTASARLFFESSLALDASDGNSWFRLGEIANAEDKTEEARDCFKEALAVSPGHQSAQAELRKLSSGGEQAESPPRPPKFNDSYVGMARSIRTERGSWRTPRVLAFDLVNPGGHQQTLHIRLAGAQISGKLNDQDWVEIHRGDAKRDGDTLQIRELNNLTTGMPLQKSMATAERRMVGRQMHMPAYAFTGKTSYRPRFGRGSGPAVLRRLPMHILVLLVAAAIAITALGSLTHRGVFHRSPRGAAGTVRTYWTDLAHADLQGAFDTFTASEQQRVGSWNMFVANHSRDLVASEKLDLGAVKTSGNTARVDIHSVVVHAPDGSCSAFTGYYRLDKTGSRWLIDNAVLQRTTAGC